MPNWFSKVFTGGAAVPRPRQSIEPTRPATPRPAFQPRPAAQTRRVVNAPVLADAAPDTAGNSADIRIKARVENGNGACTFLVDRPVFENHSAWFPSKRSAAASPLAQSLFEIPGVETVMLHDFTVTVQRTPLRHGDWHHLATEIGNRIRTHLLEEKPVVDDELLARMPSQEAIRERVQRVIDTEINPGIAGHSGAIRLDRVEGNTVYIEMMGGCQGCAASDITLRQGVHEAFRMAVPEIGAILDVTDHAAGKNPYYAQLPAGLG